jgi:prefoldin subunit 5
MTEIESTTLARLLAEVSVLTRNYSDLSTEVEELRNTVRAVARMLDTLERVLG